MLRIVISVAAIALLGACASEPVRALQAKIQSLFQSGKGEPALATGLKQYENGDYANSAKNLRAATHGRSVWGTNVSSITGIPAVTSLSPSSVLIGSAAFSLTVRPNGADHEWREDPPM